MADWCKGACVKTGLTVRFDALMGRVVGADTDVEDEDSFGLTAGMGAGFCNSGCPRTMADTGTIDGRWAGMR